MDTADAEDMVAAGGFPHRFHLSLWPWLVWQVVAVQLGVLLTPLLIAALDATQGRQAGWGVLLVAYAGSAAVANVLCLLFTVPMLRRYAVWIGPGGLWAYTYWWTPTTLPWDAPAAVGRRTMFGVPYLRVAAAGVRWPVWVPAYMADPRGFFDAVAAAAGPDHPLARALAERLSEGD